MKVPLILNTDTDDSNEESDSDIEQEIKRDQIMEVEKDLDWEVYFESETEDELERDFLSDDEKCFHLNEDTDETDSEAENV